MAGKTLTQQVNAVLATLSEDIKNNKLELPSPPDILIKIRQIAATPNSTADDISDLVKQDPHISGRLIKVANCALFGGRQHVSSVKSAVARLGFSRVQNLIIGLSIAQNMMKSKTQGLEDYLEQSWHRSNQVAAISCVLAQQKSSIDPEQALLAGMVHNIGTLPLILRLHHITELKDNPKVLKMVADVVIPKLYPKAGKLVMESWNFSPAIVSIALSHCDLTRETKDSITLDDIVAIAHYLTTFSDYTDIHSGSKEVTESAIFKKFWSSREEAEKELQTYRDEIEQMKHDITN